MLRRISALAAWLLLLHVTVFAANRACVHQAGAPTQQTDHHEHHPAPADQHQPCSLIACAMALESGATNDAAPAQPLRARLIALAAAAPESTVRAPEPPPPKA